MSGRLGLSSAQARIVGLVLQGMQDAEIATTLGVSFGTVRTHLSRIFAQLGTAGRLSLVLHIFTVHAADSRD